ncbi:MAG: hypothetical protein ACXVZI_04070 [Terriglobales bacterium]
MKAPRALAALTGIVIVSSLCLAQEHRHAGGMGGPIPEGTQVTIRMIDNLSSETAREGDTFHASLEQPILDAEGRTLYPKDADVDGRVLRAHASGRLSDPGELELTLTAITAGGRSYPVNTQPWLTKGQSHTKSNTSKIGGGAALGAIIGAVAGGGKGAAIGAGVGAGAGTGVAAASGKKEAKIESEAVLSFITAAPAAAQYAGTPAAQREPELRSPEGREPEYRSYDDARPRPFRSVFTNYDRQNIRGCFADSSSLPPGLAERDNLPPGLEKQIQRNGTLPPGLQKRAQPLPGSCSARLPRLPVDWSRVVLGRRVLLLDPDSRITDLFSLDDDD